jgi:hypothetical protein
LEIFYRASHPGTEGKSGEVFDETIGIPGKLFAKNSTPAGIGTMTDGEFFRELTSGMDRKGKVLFPLMPYQHFNEMPEEDLYSIISYIRSLPAIDNTVLQVVPIAIRLKYKVSRSRGWSLPAVWNFPCRLDSYVPLLLLLMKKPGLVPGRKKI